MNKYSSKSLNYNSNESSYNKHRRNYSPSNGSSSHSRSGTPDGRSPSRSSYQSKSSCSRRSKEHDKYMKRRKRSHERSRDRSHERSRDRSRSRSRSPCVSDTKYSKNNNHSRSVNDRYGNDHFNSNRKLCVGDWTEHYSSSGKRYFFNVKTEKSQWEKPKEWIEWENRKLSSSHRFRPSSHDRSLSRERIRDHESYNKINKEISRTNYSGNNSNSNYRDEEEMKNNYKSNVDLKHKETSENNNFDCEFINDHSSPIVNNSFVEHEENIQTNNQINDKMKITQSNSDQCSSSHINQHILSPSQVTSANLPKLISQLAGTHGLTNLSELSPHDALRTIQQALQLTKQVKSLTANQHNFHLTKQSNMNSQRSSGHGMKVESPLTQQRQHYYHQQHHHHHPQQQQHHHSHYPHHQHHPHQHYQSADGIRQELDLLINKGQLDRSPQSENSIDSPIKHESPSSTVKNISSAISSASLKPAVPTLPPTLANFFREDLIQHVTCWQADHAERQVLLLALFSNMIYFHWLL